MAKSTPPAQFLLGDRWSPVTTALIFFNVSLDDAVASFLNWRGGHVLRSTGYALTVRPVTGNLEQRLAGLLPLVSHTPRRYLFLPTTALDWTAFFDNTWRGADSGSEMTAFAARGVTGVTVVSADSSTSGGGIRRFQMVWPDAAARWGFSGRTIGVQVSDEGRWDMVDSGVTLPFEHVEHYAKRRRQDRVTHTLLAAYAGALGLQPFDEQFYDTSSPGVLLEHTNPPVAGARQFTLAEARSGGPFDMIGGRAR